MKKNASLEKAKKTIITEARAIFDLADKLDDNFIKAVELIDNTEGRVILTGIGKSGIVAKKIASTFSSIGIPAFFFHPAEGVHGELGVVCSDDLIIAISKSGDTEEILKILPLFKRLGMPIIALTGEKKSVLGRDADVILDVSVSVEACPNNLIPTSSTTVAIVMGDALAIALMEKRGLTPEDFAIFHPGGSIGRNLIKISQLMHTGEEIPIVKPNTSFSELVLEMTSKRLGTTTVVAESGALVGIITDGDLRRAIEKKHNLENLTAADVMSSKPKTISDNKLAVEALNKMEKYKITSLVITDGNKKVIGFLHMHDILEAKVV